MCKNWSGLHRTLTSPQLNTYEMNWNSSLRDIRTYPQWLNEPLSHALKSNAKPSQKSGALWVHINAHGYGIGCSRKNLGIKVRCPQTFYHILYMYERHTCRSNGPGIVRPISTATHMSKPLQTLNNKLYLSKHSTVFFSDEMLSYFESHTNFRCDKSVPK